MRRVILSLDFFHSISYSLLDGSQVSPAACSPQTSGAVVAPHQADVLALFQRLLPIGYFLAALAQAKVRENNRVYSSAVVVWLMICQRLQAAGNDVSSLVYSGTTHAFVEAISHSQRSRKAINDASHWLVLKMNQF